MWIDAYKWDHSTNPFPVHQKLSDEHIFPNDAQKMRNKLAFKTLNQDRLNLMTMYQESLPEPAQKELTAALSSAAY
ncbi:hypothetical protein ACJMK2_007030, partial [Sinanodonta woodiana]